MPKQRQPYILLTMAPTLSDLILCSPAVCSGPSGAKGSKARREKLSLREAFVFLTKSRQIRCLAVMALAQGLSTNLIEIAWKSHLHLLHPSPAAYSVRTCSSCPLSSGVSL